MDIIAFVAILALLTLSAVISNHGPSVYDLPDKAWGPDRFWTRVPPRV